MRAVMVKTQELAEAILESSYYERMKRLEREAYADEEASAALQRMVDSRRKVEDILSSADMDPEELKNASLAMNEAEEQMNANPILREWKDARKDFQTMMDNVNQILRLVITGEVSENVSTSASCSGDCAGCKGCG